MTTVLNFSQVANPSLQVGQVKFDAKVDHRQVDVRYQASLRRGHFEKHHFHQRKVMTVKT
jgi:hypothetical protein